MFGWKRKKEIENNTADIKTIHSTFLRITLDDKLLATLYHDGNDYCLAYTPEFNKTGLMPFNPNDFPKGQYPIANTIYKSPVLWNAFMSRLPSPSRDDYSKLLKVFGLSETENLLIVLGKIGKVSIAKPWKLELVESKKIS